MKRVIGVGNHKLKNVQIPLLLQDYIFLSFLFIVFYYYFSSASESPSDSSASFLLLLSLGEVEVAEGVGLAGVVAPLALL